MVQTTQSSFLYFDTLACFLVGIVALTASSFVMIGQVDFLFHADPFDAIIVDVSYEHVSKGRGSVMAYVPTVEVVGADQSIKKIKVSTYSEEPVYEVGGRIEVLCDLKNANYCSRNSFRELWSGISIVTAIGIGFLFLGFFLKRRLKATEL